MMPPNACMNVDVGNSLCLCIHTQFNWRNITGADLGFSERGFGQTSANIIQLLLLLFNNNKSFFHKKKYGQNICVFFFHF